MGKCKADLCGGVDHVNFNFLENLLIFCPLPERRVPRESNVCFEVYPPMTEKCLALVFKTDIRGNKPLIVDGGKRPDYLCLYIDSTQAICTIIEMKTADVNEAIKQIERLSDILRKNLKEYAPNSCVKMKIQGIVVCVTSTQVNQMELKRLQKHKDLTINIVNRNCPELFEYISKKNTKLGIKYPTDRTVNPRRDFTPLENILLTDPQNSFIKDECYNKLWKSKKERSGLYVNYRLSSKDFATLSSSNSGTTVYHPENHGIPKKVINDLTSFGLEKYILISSL